MSRTNKTVRTFWARLSTGYYRDPKILNVGPLGEVAFIRLLALARESVETVKIDGAIPEIVVARELRDIVDMYKTIYGQDKGLSDILSLLARYGLIHLNDDLVIVTAYNKWQTTSEEIQEVRAASAKRQQDRRDRQRIERGESLDEADEETSEHSVGGEESNSGKIKGKHTGGEGEMGLYDDKVEAFADLRKTGEVKKGRKKLGAHGIDPALEADAERVINHLVQVRTEKLGGGFKVTDTWWVDTQKLLRKNDNWLVPFTVDQLFDIIDFALSDSFWHANVQTPGGLVRNAWKIYSRDDFVAWSIRKKRPEANRPRQSLAGEHAKKPLRGELAADQKYDRTAETGKL
jgi:hypothetical protein